MAGAGDNCAKSMKMGNANEKERDPEKDTVVEKILARRVVNGKAEYLLKWEGCAEQWNSWEPIEILENLKEYIDDFDSGQEEKKKMEEQKIQAKARAMKRTSSGSSSSSSSSSGDSKCGDGGSNSGKKFRAERKSTPYAQGYSLKQKNEIEGRHSNRDKSSPPPSSLKCNAEGCGRRFDCQATLSFHQRKSHQVYYQCKVCMVNPKVEQKLKLSSQEDAKAHFTRYHKGMRWEPYTAECSPTGMSNDESSPVASPVVSPAASPVASPPKPDPAQVDKPKAANNTPKTEMEWLRLLVIDRDKQITLLQTQLNHAEDDKGILEKKLTEKDGELEASREQIENLGQTIIKKNKSIALLQGDGVRLTEKNIELEFKLEQLQMEAETQKTAEVKVACQCKDKITELEEKVAQLEGEREAGQWKDNKLVAQNVKLVKEVEKLKVKLADVEADRQLSEEIVNAKEAQLEHLLSRVQPLEAELGLLKKEQDGREERMEFLEFEVERLKRVNNERLQNLEQIQGEARIGGGYSDKYELEKKVVELEGALQGARFQVEDAREDYRDGKSKLKAVTIMWEMELEKVQKELEAQRRITMTID